MNSKVKLVGMGLIAVGATLVCVLLTHKAASPEKVVEFTYSRVQACNDKYYNYQFSIRPLLDLFEFWKGRSGAGSVEFVGKVKTRYLAFLETSAMNLKKESMSDYCGGVEFCLANGESRGHPICCRMTVRAPSQQEADLLARSYVEIMSETVEQENKSMAWKATMEFGIAHKKAVMELEDVKGRQVQGNVNGIEHEIVKTELVVAKAAVDKAKSEWDAKVEAYRKMWDSSLIFIVDHR